MSKAAAQQQAGDELEIEDGQEPGGGKAVAPKATDETKRKICEVFAEVNKHKQSRKIANDHLAALREDLVTDGFSKKAQRVVGLFMQLNDEEQEFFDMQISIMRSALGKPVQMGLELVHSGD